MLQYCLSPALEQERPSGHLRAICRGGSRLGTGRLKLCGRCMLMSSAPERQFLLRCRLAGSFTPLCGGLSLAESPGARLAEALLVPAGSFALACHSGVCSLPDGSGLYSDLAGRLPEAQRHLSDVCPGGGGSRNRGLA
jgi:hypothetical protein